MGVSNIRGDGGFNIRGDSIESPNANANFCSGCTKPASAEAWMVLYGSIIKQTYLSLGS